MSAVVIDIVYAKLAAGHRLSWLRLLAEGWRFTGWVIEPMDGHHGAHAVLMERGVETS